MSRTIQQQLTQILKREAPAPEKSWLRQEADKAGLPAVKYAPEAVMGGFARRIIQWHQDELEKITRAVEGEE